MSLTSLSQKLQKREISSRELTESFLEKIEENDSRVLSYITVCRKEALKLAEAADKKIKNGESVAITGIPFSVKDNICTAKIRTTCASRMLEGYVPAYNATCVGKLLESGGVLLGKTNLDEFGMGAFGDTSAFFTTKNPINTEFFAGGSSSGSAAAVGGDMCTFSLGSDTGGSVRLPAAFCGCVGFKPSFGAISRFGLVAYASSLDTVGVITKTASDALLLAPYLFGKDEYDMTSFDVGKNKEELVGLHGIRFSFSENDLRGCDEEVKRETIRARDILLSLGAELIPESSFSNEYPDDVYKVISCAEAMSNLARYDGIRYGGSEREALFGKEVLRRIEYGNFVLSKDNFDVLYRGAQSARKRITEEADTLFSKVDIALSPVSEFTVPKAGETKELRPDRFTVTANFAGIPSISIPVGKDRNGMPLGVQLSAGRGDDMKLLEIAKLFEKGASV